MARALTLENLWLILGVLAFFGVAAYVAAADMVLAKKVPIEPVRQSFATDVIQRELRAQGAANVFLKTVALRDPAAVQEGAIYASSDLGKSGLSESGR